MPTPTQPVGNEFEAPEGYPSASSIAPLSPQQGGKPNIAQIPDQGKASWSIDASALESRSLG